MSFVTLEQKGPVGIITMNRPDALNALNLPLGALIHPLLGQAVLLPQRSVRIFWWPSSPEPAAPS